MNAPQITIIDNSTREITLLYCYLPDALNIVTGFSRTSLIDKLI